MIIGAITYALVVSANLVTNHYIVVGANILVGLGASMLWNAQGVYLGRCALWDSRTSTKSNWLVKD